MIAQRKLLACWVFGWGLACGGGAVSEAPETQKGPPIAVPEPRVADEAPPATDVVEVEIDTEEPDPGGFGPESAPVPADPEPALRVQPEPEPGPEPDVMPPIPGGLERYLSGDDDDVDAHPTGPGVLLMGGGTDVNRSLRWWRDQLDGGDVVVLRTTGSDGYNKILYDHIEGMDSVETLVVTSRALASDPYVVHQVRHAEGIFLAGGNQSTYLKSWKDTPLEDALMRVWERGGVIAGSSAGLAVLGDLMFAAYNGTVLSEDVLADPFHRKATLDRGFLTIPPLQGVITDSHFGERDRMGRLIGFLCQIQAVGWHDMPLGIGLDPVTSAVIDGDGNGEVMGNGSVYLVKPKRPAASCVKGRPISWDGLSVTELTNGDRFHLPDGSTGVQGVSLRVVAGKLDPTDPY